MLEAADAVSGERMLQFAQRFEQETAVGQAARVFALERFRDDFVGRDFGIGNVDFRREFFARAMQRKIEIAATGAPVRIRAGRTCNRFRPSRSSA